MTVFLGVYKAIYSYEPQTPEELAIEENDLLYLLEKSDIDEWWTVKKRIIGSDEPEPQGLVPSTYVEEAPVLKQVTAVYDYDHPQNPEEELAFHENDTFDLYDDKDPDWLLVKSKAGEVGFIPGNYVEDAGASAGATAAAAAAPAAAIPIAAPIATPTNAAAAGSFLPPPQHNERNQYEEPEEEDVGPPTPARSNGRNDDDYDREDEPPRQPDRSNDARDKARNRVSYYDTDDRDAGRYDNEDRYDDRRDDDRRSGNRSRRNTRGGYDDGYDNNNGGNYNIEYHSWNVQEVDGRKKRKAKLVVGSNKINFISENGTQDEWTIDKLVSYDNEKKHMFLEFVDPYKNIELHTGNNETSKEIMDILGQIKGASRDRGLKEVEAASQSKRKAKILYDFIGESGDELTVREGDVVYIINDKKSKEWWMCESVDTGRRGVVPSQFVEPVKDKSSSGASGLFNSLKKMAKGTKSPSKSHKSSDSMSGSGSGAGVGGDWRDDVTANASSSGNRSRMGSFSSRKKRSASVSKSMSGSDNKKKFPDPKKSRLWVDRSGTFKVDAQFIGCANGKIHLHKANGVKIAVAANKLSDSDLVYVENITGFSLDKFKGGGEGPSGSGAKDSRESERERRRRLREQDEKERDRRLRENEIHELKRARQALDDERYRLQEEKDLPPIKPPRPDSTVGMPSSSGRERSKSKSKYDWFEFFLNSGVDVNQCQRYTLNFEKEQLTEDMMEDINAQMLRTLGLREGDIVRVMKFLDAKFGREAQQPLTGAQTGSMFTEPDGSLKVNNATAQNVSQHLLPQATAPATTAQQDDDAWTARPAAKSQPDLVSGSSNFTGSMQDLLDLQPLEPKKTTPAAVPEPNLSSLEPVKTGGAGAAPAPAPAPVAPVTAALTGGATLAPLDPFKTGGNNILPIGTGFVMMPIATGGMMPMQRTGGMGMPMTTFGAQLTGGVLPVQKTSGGLIPVATTGGLMPQTTFGAQTTGGLMPLQTTGGFMPLQRTGGLMPQTTFGAAAPLGSVLPVQKTANGLMPMNTTGGAMLPLQITGGGMPQTSFMNPALTGGMNPIMTNSLTGGALPQTSFGAQMTGGAMPQTSFGAQMTGGAMPQMGFGNQMTGGAMPQNTFGNQMTGGAMPQNTFGSQMTGGATMPMQRTGGFQPQSQFGMTLQRTGGVMPINTGVNNITQGLQNTSISQPQQLQTQPTGFGFGNGPQANQQGRQANIFNASAANPFGF